MTPSERIAAERKALLTQRQLLTAALEQIEDNANLDHSRDIRAWLHSITSQERKLDALELAIEYADDCEKDAAARGHYNDLVVMESRKRRHAAILAKLDGK